MKKSIMLYNVFISILSLSLCFGSVSVLIESLVNKYQGDSFITIFSFYSCHYMREFDYLFIRTDNSFIDYSLFFIIILSTITKVLLLIVTNVKNYHFDNTVLNIICIIIIVFDALAYFISMIIDSSSLLFFCLVLRVIMVCICSLRIRKIKQIS